jgi:beta-galactosidase
VLGPDVDVRSGPFDAGASVNGASLGYTVGGIGWYRNVFPTPAEPSVSIRFDGVYENSDVYVNGQLVGHHPYGYTGFEYDVSHLLRPAGENNSLAVRVANTGKNSRWYSGSGIYRHVVLSARPAVHVPRHGVVVTTPEIDVVNGTHARGAVVHVVATVRNSGARATTATVRVGVAPGAHSAAPVTVGVAAHSSATVRVDVRLGGSVALWTPDTPALRVASVVVSTGGGHNAAAPASDANDVSFGVRQLQFDAARGFRLNGLETKLYGGCVHHDNGPLGSAAIDRAEERRVELLKRQGYNAVRTSHNPVSPAFLDACDRLGVMVMSEAGRNR